MTVRLAPPLDLVRRRGLVLGAAGLERANAMALIDVTDPSAPTVVDIAAVGSAPEGIKFVTRGRDLSVVTPNEASGTVSVLEVVF